jgi:DNA polymerase elongation subunit (family B)
MEHIFKLFEFNIYNEKQTDKSSDEEEITIYKDNSTFMIQMFGINELGETSSIIVEDYQPFFYVKVQNNWNKAKKELFLSHIKSKIGKFYENSITECKLIEKKKLYGFDAGKLHRFIVFKFSNIQVFNKVKNLWYINATNDDGETERKLIKNGYNFQDDNIELYEANIPPLLRFFHIREISPSGWIALPIKKTREIININKTTTCNYEFAINFKCIIPLNNIDTIVPYKILSFDIEASSSHGDFPVPIKSYKKLATNIVDYIEKNNIELTKETCNDVLRNIIKKAFGYITNSNINMDIIELVYPKIQLTLEEVETQIESWLKTKVRDRKDTNNEEHLIETLFENAAKTFKEANNIDDKEEDNDEDNELVSDEINYNYNVQKTITNYKNKQSTIIDILCDKKFEREGKINELIRSLRNNFPALEGDKVTFIGSTFMKYGSNEPYLNHCIALNSCSNVQNGVIESYNSEKEVLLAWTNLVQRENPDIIIGYNIFSFDYEFMFRRAQELDCVEDFLKLSRNKDELCATQDYKKTKLDIDRSSITLASGTYELAIVKMNGRLQVDMLNWFRRTENLTSYKLDYVASHFIGDVVKGLEQLIDRQNNKNYTRIKTNNMIGLQVDSYIHFQEINHSSDYYKNGAKFKVIELNKSEGWFKIHGHENPQGKTIKWGLAKDDVTPKDIFRMTHEGPESRGIIAKYCIQDCNLVHYLFNKVDVVTDLVEMAKLCSVPMSFLVFRGQGIKLTSYVAKKCREKGVLMPVIDKGSKDDGYEGAIVLEPKCGLYLDKPVAVGDFASLYPSSMLSENLCPSSKVWTKIYDLAGNLILETGERDYHGNYIYDNLVDYEYVDIQFDTYRYVRKTPKARAEKVKAGHKICRFAQKKGIDEKAIMPSILQELLKARKDTRKLIPQQTDEFMKNVLDKRQLAYKVTANSLYGQLGAKTSTFYEPDIAASTTATGRKLLTYAKQVVEECYADYDIETNYGLVNTKAEYIYGDSVASYTPIYIRTKNKVIDILSIQSLASIYGNNDWRQCLELGKQTKEVCELENVETWTENGWTKLHRIIRHKLAPHKKMFRILTKTACIDVTDDHSLLLNNKTEVSPKDVSLGTELLHTNFNFNDKYDITTYLSSIFKKHMVYNEDIKCFVDDRDHFNSIMSRLCCYLNYKNIDYTLDYNKDSQIINLNVDDRRLINLTKEHLSTDYINLNNNEIRGIYEIDYDYNDYVYDLTTDNHHFAAGIGNLIVHNTDSVFFTFNLSNKETGEPIIGKQALELSIEIAQDATKMVSKFLKQPHDWQYEKTFLPFCLLSKKRYVGMLYEHDPNKGKRKEMGIVLKRRDNAPIVKDVYGGIIDILMKEHNLQKAIDYLNKCLQELVNGTVSMDKLIITKSLRSFYKNPQQIAHKVLADRIGQREPGNKPSSGDRIPFVYIVQPNKKALQGEKIETPTFIKEHNLQIDYSFYITNQIMKPLLQLFGLVLEDIWRNNNKISKLNKFKKEIFDLKNEYVDDNKKYEEKLIKLKDKEVKILLFDKYLRETNNTKEGNQSVTSFFTKIVK